MKSRPRKSLYVRLLESIPIDPFELLLFRFPDFAQRRLSQLIRVSKERPLNEKERQELEQFLAADALVGILKAKALRLKRRIA